MAAALDITLIFPPHWLSYQPYMSLPALAGHLKASGYTSVRVADANVLAVDWMLSPDFLGPCAQRVESAASSGPDAAQAMALDRVLPLAQMLVEDVEWAKATLRDRERFYVPSAYARAMRILKNAYRLISAAWWPTEISFNGCKLPYSATSSKQIRAALDDRETDCFVPFFREALIPSLDDPPQLVGLSIMCEDQVIPAFRLASMLAEAFPEVCIVAGGAFPTALVPELGRAPDLFETIDYFVVNEGEDALLGLVRALDAGEPVHGLPNVLSCRDGQVITGPIALQPVDHLATPDFSDLPLDLYLAPEFIAHLQASRGCYYNKCKFCAHVATNVEEKFRSLPLDHVLRDVTTVRERYGSRFFNFWDEAIPPAMLRRLSEQIIEQQWDIRWNCLGRFERALTPELCQLAADAGCLEISFGIESACPRVLQAMGKGTDVEVIEQVLRNCAGAGIATNLYAMVGYPTETEEEARETLDFVLRNRESITHVIFSVFTLRKNARLMHELDAHAVELLVDPDEDLRIRYPYRITRDGCLTPADSVRLSGEFTRRVEAVGLTSPNAKAGAHFLLFLARGVDPVGTQLEQPDVPTALATRISVSPHVQIFHGRASGGQAWAVDRSTWRLFSLPPAVLTLLRIAEEPLSREELVDRLAPAARRHRESYQTCVQRLLRQGVLVSADSVGDA